MEGAENGSYLQKKKVQMDDEKLIELVKQNNALYDVANCRYVDSAYREKVWKEISEELKQSPIFCKKRWYNIRDNFKKALRKMALKNEQGYKTMKKYKYSYLLEFLGYTNTIENRESRNASPVEIKFELDTDNNTEESENFDICSQADEKSTETDNEEKLTQMQIPQHNCGVKRKREELGTDVSKFIRYLSENTVMDRRATEKHPVDAFLTGIAPTLKSLSPYYLSLAKTQIYSIVQEYEMAMIMEQKKL